MLEEKAVGNILGRALVVGALTFSSVGLVSATERASSGNGECRWAFNDAAGPPVKECTSRFDLACQEGQRIDYIGREASTGEPKVWITGRGLEWCDDGTCMHRTDICDFPQVIGDF